MPDASYRVADVHTFVVAVLERLGIGADDVAPCAEMLLYADRSGVATHGVANLVWHLHYGPGLRDGHVNPRPSIEVLRDGPGFAAWDADRGFGPLVARRAMQAAIDKASRCGVGTVTVRNGCHFGAQAYLVELAAERGMIGMSMTHSPPAMLTPGGLDRLVGTNPIGSAVPSADGAHLVVDMSTTAISGTKALFARRDGTPLPWGTLADADGAITTDAAAQAAGGGLLPLGTLPEAGSAKGFGLGLLADAMSGLLSGNGSSSRAEYASEWRVGGWFAAWDVAAFGDPEEFGRGVAELGEAVARSRPIDPEHPPRLPGRGSAARRQRSDRDGIALASDTVERGIAFGESIGVPFPGPTADGSTSGGEVT